MKKNNFYLLVALCCITITGLGQNTNKLVKYTGTTTATGPSSLIESAGPRLGFPLVIDPASYFEIRKSTNTGSLLRLNGINAPTTNNYIDFMDGTFGIYQSSNTLKNYFAGSIGVGELPNYNYMLNVKGPVLATGLTLSGYLVGQIHTTNDNFRITITTPTSSNIELEIYDQYTRFYNKIIPDAFQLTANAGTGKVLVSDKDGNGTWTDPGQAQGDNMGNHTATEKLKMGDYSILNNEIGGKTFIRTSDGTEGYPGLRFQNGNENAGRDLQFKNSMVLEPGCHNARFALIAGTVAGKTMSSSLWLSNWHSGGYGFVFNGESTGTATEHTGGIYLDANDPKLVMGFNRYNVGIGIIPPADSRYKLFVSGGIMTEEVKVVLKGGPEWPDYVFASNYKMNSLSDVEAYISKNKHLPELPSAENVKKEGINLGEMNALLLKKIEELTLYMIDQQKQIEALKAAIAK